MTEEIRFYRELIKHHEYKITEYLGLLSTCASDSEISRQLFDLLCDRKLRIISLKKLCNEKLRELNQPPNPISDLPKRIPHVQVQRNRDRIIHRSVAEILSKNQRPTSQNESDIIGIPELVLRTIEACHTKSFCDMEPTETGFPKRKKPVK